MNALQKKKQLGQFFTSNSDYILSGLEKFVSGKKVQDPFAGDGDLLFWAKRNGAKKISGFDVDRQRLKYRFIIENDSLINPVGYNFVITNPPYLNVNKSSKDIKEKYFSKFKEFEDLYQISVFNILNSEEGIIVLPINFLSANNAKRIRRYFFSKFEIVKLNYFKHQVFDDTTYNVVAFYYRKLKMPVNKIEFPMFIYPESKKITIKIEEKYDWTIGGDFLHKIELTKNSLGIRRLLEDDVESGKISCKTAIGHLKKTKNISVSEGFINRVRKNIIILKAIDSGTEKGKIALEDIRSHQIDALLSKESSRHMIHLVFPESVSVFDQELLIKLFNKHFSEARKKYSSLFLTNYRDNDRKRVQFDFVYKFLNMLYLDNIKQVQNRLFENVYEYLDTKKPKISQSVKLS